MERIQKIQLALYVPKEQKGQNYKYRTLPQELEALLPLLAKHGLTMTLPVDFQPSNDENYVIAHCIVCDAKTGNKVAETTYPTMDSNPMIKGGQGTGAACTYAKKGAIDSMFLLDANDPNSVDLDTIGAGEPKKETPKETPIPKKADNTETCPKGYTPLNKGQITETAWLKWGADLKMKNFNLAETLKKQGLWASSAMLSAFSQAIDDYMIDNGLK